MLALFLHDGRDEFENTADGCDKRSVALAAVPPQFLPIAWGSRYAKGAQATRCRLAGKDARPEPLAVFSTSMSAMRSKRAKASWSADDFLEMSNLCR